MRKALILSIVAACALTSCAPKPNDLPFGPLSPAKETRATAKRLSLQKIKMVRIRLMPSRGASQNLKVTNPQIIKQLISGLKTATETNISNQVSYIEVVGKDGKTLLWEQFSVDYPSHALSLDFDQGLRQAGAQLSWSRSEAKARWKELNAQP